MKRKQSFRVPDAVNCSSTLNFTQVPNHLLKNPNLTGTAKTILGISLSNKEGWCSYITTLKQMMSEGETAIRSGIALLETHGYLMRIRFRDIKTKAWKGTLWVYTDTPHKWNDIDDRNEYLKEHGYELVFPKQFEKSHVENPDVGFPDVENPALKILSNNNIKNNKTNLIMGDKNSNKKPSIKERNKKFLPLAEKLSNIIQTSKNIKHTSSQINIWADEIRKLHENNEISIQRIKTVLEWYGNNIGGEYIPVIESGASFRQKFIRLEGAMQRQQNDHTNSNRYKPKPKQEQEEEEINSLYRTDEYIN